MERSALVDGYVVATMVVGGYVWPLGEPREEAQRQSDLCVRNVAVLAVGFVDAGITLTFLGTHSSVTTMYGEALTVTTDTSGTTPVVLVNGVATIAPELRASNGIIIPIAGVLLPTV